MTDCVLPLDNIEVAKKKVISFLDKEKNESVRNILKKYKPDIVEKNEEMWDLIWHLKK